MENYRLGKLILFVCSALQTRHQVHPKPGRFSPFDTVLAYTKKIQQ